MALPARTTSSAIPADWLPLSDVAARLGLSERSAQRLALESAAKGRARKGPLPGGSGGVTWWLSRSIDPRLARVIDRDTRDEQDRVMLSERFPAHLLDRAYRKARWMHRWRELVADSTSSSKVAATRIVSEARAAEGPAFKISVRSLELWWSAYQTPRDDGRIRGVEALVDRYTGPSSSSSAIACCPLPVACTRSPEAIDYFYSLYHTTLKLSVAQCHEATVRHAEQNRLAGQEGWSWPASYSSTRRWLAETDDLSTSCLMREGGSYWSRRYMRYAHMDYSRLPVGGLYMADHTRCDFWCWWGRRQLRPWLTAVMDIRSRCVVGWHLGPEAHQDAILSALRTAFRDWAVPRELKIDNGADFASKLITGLTKVERRSLDRKVAEGEIRYREDNVLCDDVLRWGGITGELGIDLKFALPFCPWAKGPVERWFGTFHAYSKALFATYCGRGSADKPEAVDEVRFGRRVKRGVRIFDPALVPTMDQARETVREIVLRYHHRRHRSLDASPLAVWHTAQSLRRADDKALATLMSIRGAYKVHANGVTLRVGAGTVSYGAKAACLKKLRGREVLVSLDQAEIGHVWALDAKTRRIIGRLDANEYIEPGVDVDHAREATAQVKREQAQIAKARRSQVKRTRTANERMNRDHRERVAELRATGTDTSASCLRASVPSCLPVRTGFEGVSIPASVEVAPPPKSRYDDVDFASLRLTDPGVSEDDDEDVAFSELRL
ncbi:MAG: transposase family protein [Phycisphaerae bacterium]|nr:transposase family protein [Phycisphaerae bacterium]